MPENRGCGGFGFGDDCCWMVIEEDVANLFKKRNSSLEFLLIYFI